MRSQYVLPITIVVAGLLIAGAVFLVGKSGTSTPGSSTTATNVRAYDPAKDHILGNPQAPVKIVEYADLECPYCKVFHTTMHQIVDYYNQNAAGQVAWVFRPFPLGSIHSKAPEEAQAAECAADQGGDAAFFKYIDKIYQITPSENNLDLTQLPVVAGQIGLNVNTFNQCLSSGKFAQKVTDSYSEAISEGGQGTPYIILMANNAVVHGGVLSGAQPYDSMRAAIDAVLQGMGKAPTTGSATNATTTH
jgi:protein-disulfide isomerase